MYYLNKFLCCMHLYIGCLISGFTGIVLCIVAIPIVILKVFPICVYWFAVAVVCIIVYFLAKILLLVGAICGYARIVLASFIIGLIALIYPIALLVWYIYFKELILTIAALTYFIIMELYYSWVVLSYWKVVKNCCKE